MNTESKCPCKDTPKKLDMKDKAIKMLIESFEKKLYSVESIACRKGTPSLEIKRRKLLDSFEEYIKELLVC
jgi:hypothetical protein